MSLSLFVLFLIANDTQDAQLVNHVAAPGSIPATGIAAGFFDLPDVGLGDIGHGASLGDDPRRALPARCSLWLPYR